MQRPCGRERLCVVLLELENHSSEKELSRKQEYITGIKAGVPVIIGFVSVAMAFAIMAIQSGLYKWQAVMMSAMVFAGASQMIAVTMFAQQTGIMVIILATFIINLRHLIMSTCVMNRMKDVPLPMRLLASFGVTDESFALFTTTEEKKASIFYFLGMITVTYSSWVLGTGLGCVAMQFLPDLVSKSLNITLYAMFIGLLAPNMKGNLRLVLVVLLTAVISFILRLFLDSAWTIICATLLGAVIGVQITGNHMNCSEAKEVTQ